MGAELVGALDDDDDEDVESTSLTPLVCLPLELISKLPFTLLLIILLMKISFINISAVVDVSVGVVHLFCVGDKEPLVPSTEDPEVFINRFAFVPVPPDVIVLIDEGPVLPLVWLLLLVFILLWLLVAVDDGDNDEGKVEDMVFMIVKEFGGEVDDDGML